MGPRIPSHKAPMVLAVVYDDENERLLVTDTPKTSGLVRDAKLSL